MADNRMTAAADGESKTEAKGVKHLLSKHEKTLTGHPPRPIKDRKCTDCLFLILYLLYWIGMIVMAGIGFKNGDPRRLVYATDYNGNTCGVGNLSSKTLAVFPRSSEDLFFNLQKQTTPWDIDFFTICMATCPSAGDYVCTDAAEADIATAISTSGGAYTRDDYIMNCLKPEALISLNYFDLDPPCPSDNVRTQCWATLFNTTSILFRCLPMYIYEVAVGAGTGCATVQNVTNPITQEIEPVCVRYKQVTVTTTIEPTSSNALFDSFNSVAQQFDRYFGDLYFSYEVIIGFGFGFSIMLGLLFIFSMWCCIGPMVWLTVIGTILICIALTAYCYVKAGYLTTAEAASLESELGSYITSAQTEVSTLEAKAGVTGSSASVTSTTKNHTTNATEAIILAGNELSAQFGVSESFQREYEIAAWVMTAVSVIIFFLVLALGSRISRAIEIFGEAAMAIRGNLCLVILPFVSLCFILSMLVFWAGSSAYVASVQTYDIARLNYSAPVKPGDPVVNITIIGDVTYSNILIIYLFIGMLWTLAFINGITTMITAGAVGSWYWGGENGGDPTYGHFPIKHSTYATLRFHLGTIALGSLIVAIMQFIQYIAAYIDAKTANLQKENRVMMVIMCCIQCFLKCVENCVQFISRNAYIQCAMYGGNFCTSTQDAFSTMAHNAAQVATVNFLGDIILRFGQIFVTVLAGLSCWVYLDVSPQYNYGGEYELSSFWFPTFLTAFLAWNTSSEIMSVYDIAVETLLLQYCQDKKIGDSKGGDAKPTGGKSSRLQGFLEKHDDKKVAPADKKSG